MFLSLDAEYFEGLLYTYPRIQSIALMDTPRKALLEPSLSKSEEMGFTTLLPSCVLMHHGSGLGALKPDLTNLSTTEECQPPPHILLPLPCLEATPHLEMAKALGLSQ